VVYIEKSTIGVTIFEGEKECFNYKIDIMGWVGTSYKKML
jgi:hypothetical protein